MKKESGERDSKEGFEPSEQVPHLLVRESEPVGENVKFEEQPSSHRFNQSPGLVHSYGSSRMVVQ